MRKQTTGEAAFTPPAQKPVRGKSLPDPNQAIGLEITFGSARDLPGAPTTSRRVGWNGQSTGQGMEEPQETRWVGITGTRPAYKRPHSPSREDTENQRQVRHKPNTNCPVSENCSCSGHVHRHVISVHMPFFVQPETACWGCNCQCVRASALRKHLEVCSRARPFDDEALGLWVRLSAGLLDEIAGQMGVRTRHLNRLVDEKHLALRDYVVSPLQAALMHHYDRALGTKERTDGAVHPPNSEGGLLHWRLLAALVALCNPKG